ncbi:MAG: type II toxin-antitoxin system VapC family toxin [bacterium]|nr:type II toxin-antitoxin system VapC family toxin [bacterium]
MRDLVVDASVAGAWFLGEPSALADMALARLEEDRAVVPQIWHLEVRNALLTAERRSRLSAAQMTDSLLVLRHLPIRTDRGLDLALAFDLARIHNLSFYDAVYLELAKRTDGELATLDRALHGAAVTEAVSVMEESPSA